MSNWHTYKIVSTWQELYGHLSVFQEQSDVSWLFRGQKNACWGLKTGIDKLRDRFSITSKMYEYEWKVTREFMRRAHNYHSNLPTEDDLLEWIALLRHHYGPTRLLDVSYSPFVAAYFAVEEADNDSAVWAINASEIKKRVTAIVTDNKSRGRLALRNFRNKRDGLSFRCLFFTPLSVPFVSIVNPQRLNERLTAQQGAFLCPGDVEKSFEENVIAMKLDETVIQKIVIPRCCQKEALLVLRKMNIDRTTLFPDLDGFAQALNSRFDEIGNIQVSGSERGFAL